MPRCASRRRVVCRAAFVRRAVRACQHVVTPLVHRLRHLRARPQHECVCDVALAQAYVRAGVARAHLVVVAHRAPRVGGAVVEPERVDVSRDRVVVRHTHVTHLIAHHRQHVGDTGRVGQHAQRRRHRRRRRRRPDVPLDGVAEPRLRQHVQETRHARHQPLRHHRRHPAALRGVAHPLDGREEEESSRHRPPSHAGGWRHGGGVSGGGPAVSEVTITQTCNQRAQNICSSHCKGPVLLRLASDVALQGPRLIKTG